MSSRPGELWLCYHQESVDHGIQGWDHPPATVVARFFFFSPNNLISRSTEQRNCMETLGIRCVA